MARTRIGWRAGTAAAAALASGLLASGAAAEPKRDQIRIVGSSTVYPFASYVAEEFGKTTKHPTPVTESTGSGGGHKIWGKSVAIGTPDITNSSRKMKVSEFKRARKNGVGSITEAMIGYDGIAIAQNDANPAADFTLEQITLAVAAEVPNPDGKGLVENPYDRWSEIDEELPDRRISIYGPPTTSGTRDAFEELVMEAASEEIAAYGGAYTKIRQDQAWINAGENDNLIVKKLAQNRDAFGIFGYSFLAENKDRIQAASINGVEPRPDAISSGEYPIARSLYFYVKNDHYGKVAGLKRFVKLFMSEKMIGPVGYLTDIGLIPLPEKMREASRRRVVGGSELELRKVDGKPELTDLKDFMKGEE